ncbi:MAG: hypothetical protein IPK19_14780 [Chloroflexi bacterium]|nr:hypothetical protein [Chloroflexota bacterium]
MPQADIACGEPIPLVSQNALIGRVGDHVFLVGAANTIVTQDAGELFLRSNDVSDGMYDNSGLLKVSITVEEDITSQLSGRTLRIWRVGSIEAPDDVPSSELNASYLDQLETHDLRYDVQAFSAADFPAAFFDALDRNAEPDILVAHYSSIQNFAGSRSSSPGLITRPGVREILQFASGFFFTDGPDNVFLVRTAANYLAARELILSNRVCPAYWQFASEMIGSTMLTCASRCCV